MTRCFALISLLVASPTLAAEDHGQRALSSALGAAHAWWDAVGVIAAHSPGSPHPAALQLQGAEVVSDAAGHALRVDLRNTGGNWVMPKVWVAVYDAGGASVGQLSASLRGLYPGDTGEFWVDVSELSSGTFAAFLVAEQEDGGTFTSSVPFVLPP
jgi:hypothetical protein